MTAITRTATPFDTGETPGAAGFDFLAFGWVGQIDLTADSSAITTVETAFGSATVNTRNDRRYLVLVNIYTEQSVADDLFLFKLLEDGVEIRRWRNSNNVAGSSGHVTPTFMFMFAPAATASHTYSVTVVREVGSGNVVAKTGTQIALIDIGAAT